MWLPVSMNRPLVWVALTALPACVWIPDAALRMVAGRNPDERRLGRLVLRDDPERLVGGRRFVRRGTPRRAPRP